MLIHMVQFNFKPQVGEEKRNEVLAAAREKLGAIPGVANLLAGKSIKPDSEFEYALSMHLPDEAALQAYRAHPNHVEFRDVDFFPYLSDRKALDYAD